ncbi:MAG: ABC transporter ATP-binding protein/permease [Anaerostipes sp.]|nr:ABC transporter ATP-binding protein/permease [Anaerostipes sp.]
MIRILKFARKRWYTMVLIITLLLGQAYCELTLPQYTSNIVDVGIQYKGIERTIPEAVRPETFQGLLGMISDSDEKELVQDAYELIEKGSDKDLEELYPALEKSNLYVLDYDSLGEEKADKLTEVVTDAELKLMELMASTPEMQKKLEKSASMSKENIDQLKDVMGDSLAVAFIQEEYKAIGVDMDQYQMNYLKKSGVKMMALAMGSMVMAILVTFFASRLAAVTSKELRNKVFRKVVSFSNEEMNHFSTASLITRCTNDIQQVQMVMVLLFRMVLYAPIMGIGGIVKVLHTDTSMVWIIALAVIVLLGVVMILMSAAMPKFKKMQVLVDRLNLVTREILTGIPVVRAFSREKYEEQRFEGASYDLMKTQLFTNRVMTFMMPTMMFIMNGVSVLIIWVGAHGIDAGNLQVGDMMAFITYTMQIIMAFLMMTMISVMLPRAAVAAERIDEVLESDTLITDAKEPKDVNGAGEVEFHNVGFAYPGAKEEVLQNISFTAKAGQTTAFIGSTGSGKSTLVQLIPRLFDVTEGKITIDGEDIRNIKLSSLRENIGYVPQKGLLFSGTIESNLRFGTEEAPVETIKKAAKIAQAEEFIDSKPLGYQTPISQGGSNVSGGQKQRLAIARAIAKEPKIYIFDDSFSALDYKTDVTLRKALQKEVGDAVVMIVAQRISTILHADKIIVLDEGRIVGEGTHEELLKTNPVYQEIAKSQLSKQELEGEV